MTERTQSTAADTYAASHQHPANRALHAVGIPVIACCGIAAFLGPGLIGASRRVSLAGVVAGAALLFVGHAIEGNRPAIFTRRRAVLDAIRWWGREATRICQKAFTL